MLTSLQNIGFLSMTVIVHAGVKSTNVVCPHNGTYDICIFAIFSKTDFVDIVPLCCKPLLSTGSYMSHGCCDLYIIRDMDGM